MTTMTQRILAAVAAILLAGAVKAQLPTPQPQPINPIFAQVQGPAGLSTDAPIGPRDVLDVRVFQDPSFNNPHATVTDDGLITIPTLGKIEVTGLTPSQLEQRLKALLEAKYLAKAEVSVSVIEAGSKPISVIGAVMRPGRIPATGNMNLIQALTNAGGLTNGYGKDLVVLRTGTNGLTEQIAIDIDDLLVRGNADLNIPLRSNDVVNVSAEQPILVYVVGEVMRPGKVSFRRAQNPTLLQAIADSGGTTDRASKKVRLKRIVNGKEQTLPYDLKRIMSGKNPDVPLLDGDTIVVAESFF
jgi:polysaccharide export outer membrane protein